MSFTDSLIHGAKKIEKALMDTDGELTDVAVKKVKAQFDKPEPEPATNNGGVHDAAIGRLREALDDKEKELRELSDTNRRLSMFNARLVAEVEAYRQTSHSREDDEETVTIEEYEALKRDLEVIRRREFDYRRRTIAAAEALVEQIRRSAEPST